ncbi:MAG: MlaD family protein [Desulfobulbus sp.]|nr:MlaD family protein [Desulfobulbus sp.]
MEKPIIRKHRSLSPIWILPLVALCIGGWLLYTGMRDAGIDITVHFEDATGINPGKTKVIVRGIPVGTVKKLNIDPGMKGVSLIITMDSQMREALVSDTTFWIVKPEVSAGKISGLDTLFGGSYIGMRQGKSTSYTEHFKGLPEQPSIDNTSPGLHITLETNTLYSLQRGSNIYTKNMQIGYIEDYLLQENGKILLRAFIEARFTRLIHKGTRFWNASGLSLTGDVQSGLTVNVESLASLIYGGLSCETPASLVQSPLAENGAMFSLYKDFEDAEYGIPAKLQLASGEGIVASKTKVMYRGLKAGVVKQIDINDDALHTVTAVLLLDPRAEPALRETTRFWTVRPQVQITGVKNLETLLTGPYITFEIGSGDRRETFIEEPGPMPNPVTRPGTSLTLVAPESGGLNVGAPVLFKEITVGEVTGVALAPKGEKVLVKITVFAPHDTLINKKSVFWKTGGFKVDASLSRIKVELGSLQSLLAGGIAFMTPSAKTAPAVAAAGDRFLLYPSYGEAIKTIPEMELQGLRLHLVTSQAPRLSVGAPLLFNNIPVGEVLGFDLARNRRDTVIHILIQEQYRDLINKTSRFYTVSPVKLKASLQGVNLETAPFDALINGGISFFTAGQGSAVHSEQNFPLYASAQEAENADALRLHLHFKSGEGISTSTEIRYQGIKVGRLSALQLDPASSEVRAEACVDPAMATLFRRNSRLRLIRPEANITGIKHVETLLSGAYIDLQQGLGAQITEFTVLPLAEDTTQPKSGLNLILETSSLGSLKKGNPIYYRQIRVGQIIDYQLSPTAQEVWLKVNIEEPFSRLIYTGTRFWNASGIKVSGGVLSGMTVRAESVESLLVGGIGLATPEGTEMGPPAYPGQHFKVSETIDETWLKWHPQIPLETKAAAPPTVSKKR